MDERTIWTIDTQGLVQARVARPCAPPSHWWTVVGEGVPARLYTDAGDSDGADHCFLNEHDAYRCAFRLCHKRILGALGELEAAQAVQTALRITLQVRQNAGLVPCGTKEENRENME